LKILEWLWFTKIEQVIFMLLGIVAAVFSVGAFIAEALTFVNISFFNLEEIIQHDDTFLKNQVNFFLYFSLLNIFARLLAWSLYFTFACVFIIRSSK